LTLIKHPPLRAGQYDMDLIMLARVQRKGLAQWLGGTAEQVLYKTPSSAWQI
jgi:nucleotide-binding universal stress UspA family protein